MHIHSLWVHWRIVEGSIEGLKKGLNTSTDIKYEMVEYEILWINSYGFNSQLEQSDEEKLFNTLNRRQKFREWLRRIEAWQMKN